ncbi:MAG: hypothetical protein V3U43_03590 [Pseudomonadales bacterium]
MESEVDAVELRRVTAEHLAPDVLGDVRQDVLQMLARMWVQARRRAVYYKDAGQLGIHKYP